MDDKSIIELYFARDERAIEETKLSYGRLLLSIARNILGDPIDSEECESDTYVRTWNSIPPTVPDIFSAYLAKITRNLAINRLRDNKRRGALQSELVFEEIEEALPATTGDATEDMELRDALNDFIEGLDKTKRKIFMKRYFFMRSVKEISAETGISQGAIKVSLSRMRKMLREHLESRGIVI